MNSFDDEIHQATTQLRVRATRGAEIYGGHIDQLERSVIQIAERHAADIVAKQNHGAETCAACHYRLPKQRKEILNGQKYLMLRRAAGHVMSTMVNDFKVSDFTEPVDFKSYNFFSHLRLHGLIAKVKIDGKVQRGRWLITRNGWRFLRGDIELPEFLLVRNNKIVSRSETTVSVRDVMRDDTMIVTSFDYFDDYGQAVGRFPNNDGRQGRLL